MIAALVATDPEPAEARDESSVGWLHKGLRAGFGGMVISLTCPRLVLAQNEKSLQFKLPWVAEGSNRLVFRHQGMGFWEKHGARCRYRARVGVRRRGASDRRRPARFRHGHSVHREAVGVR
jgi:hypothetical protein